MAFTRRGFLAATGSTSLVAALSACSGSPSPGSSGTAAAKEIVFWNNLPDEQQLKYFTAHFVDAYPGSAKVVFTQKPNLDRLTQTSLAAGSGPDIIVTPGPSTAVSEFNKAGFLADLTPYEELFGWDDAFASWALDTSRVDGKLVTVPTAYETMVFFYNPGTLDAAGLKVPTTKDEFEAFCTDLKGAGKIPVAAGNADWKGANEWYVGHAFNHGAGPEAVYSALTGETPFTDAAFVDAITRMAGYFANGWFGGSVESYFTTTFPMTYGQLADGTAGGMMSGTWDFANLAPYFGEAASNEATWDFAQIPALGDNTPSDIWDLAIGQSLGINAKASDLDATAEYLNWLTTDVDTIIAAVEAVNFQPSPIHIEASDFSAAADERTVRLYSSMSQATTIGYTTWTFFPPKTETYLIDYFEQVLTGKLSPADYCAGIQEQFAKEFAAGAVPPIPAPTGHSE